MNESERRGRVHAALDRALAAVTLSREDFGHIRTWINRELPQLQAAGYTTHLVFGSYRRGYHRSIRLVQYEINKPASTTAILLGDTPPLGLTISSGRQDPLEFEIVFHLLTAFADHVIGVYEKDSGGEAVELGLLRQGQCFPRTAVLPRAYYGVGRGTFDSREEVLRVARHVAFAADLPDERKIDELRGVIATAREAGIDITEHEMTVALEEARAEREEDTPAYSWVHLAVFRQFEEAGRCYPWFSKEQLREHAQQIAASGVSSGGTEEVSSTDR